jgi:hypothetical protein
MGAVVVRPAAVAAPLWQKVPFKMPANALVPHKVAERILQPIETAIKARQTSETRSS